MKIKKKWGFPSDVRSRLLCIFLCSVLIPVMTYGIIVSFSSSKELEQENYNTYQQMTNQIDAVFSEYISRTDQTLRSVDNSLAVPQFLRNEIIVTIGLEPDINFLKDNAFAALKQLGDTNTSIYSLTAITLEGDTVSYVERKRDTFLDDFNSDYYSILKKSTSNTVVLPIKESKYENSASREVFTVGYKHLDYAEGISGIAGYTGYIIAECPTTKFKEFCEFVELDKNMNVYILDQNKHLAYTTEENEIHKDDFMALFKSEIDSGHVSVGGNDYILVSSSLSDTGWMAYTTVPYDTITMRSTQLLLTFFVLCLVCMLIIIIVTYAVSGYFTKPIITLQQAMKTVSKGDLSIRVSEKRSDEFGDLNAGFNNLMEKLDQLIKDVSEAQVRRNVAEYQMLQSQINPHFLYNTLDTIRMMAVISDEDTIATALLHLSTLFRYHTKKGTRLVTIKEELIQINNYLYLQKLRFQDRLQITYEIQEDILDYKMPKILLQPILENSLSHGFSDTAHTYVLQIKICQESNYIAFTISDNGCGMSQDTLLALRQRLSTLEDDEQHGIGLYNVNKRLHLYFSDIGGLVIESEQQKGTTVIFRIPILNDESSLFKYDEYLNTSARKDNINHE